MPYALLRNRDRLEVADEGEVSAKISWLNRVKRDSQCWGGNIRARVLNF